MNDIQTTVALPIWNSSRIAWLCLESLCRQNKPVHDWELLVFEEQQPAMVGENYIRTYADRLKEVGCVRIHYITAFERIPLSQKWVRISKHASGTSKGFCLCAADNYYHPWLIQDAEKAMEQYDWFITTSGYFYDFNLRKTILYRFGGNIGLQMTAKTSLVQRMPMEVKNRGVDGWFYRNLHPAKMLKDLSNHWRNTLCTNGLNNISKSRHTFFTRLRKPFYESDRTLEQIVPNDIYNKIILLSNSMQKVK